MYFGEWPWKELHLVSESPETVCVWQEGLQGLIVGLRTHPPREKKVDYWLKCMYVDLKRQNGDTVHAVTALGSFAGLRLWKAYRVC